MRADWEQNCDPFLVEEEVNADRPRHVAAAASISTVMSHPEPCPLSSILSPDVTASAASSASVLLDCTDGFRHQQGRGRWLSGGFGGADACEEGVCEPGVVLAVGGVAGLVEGL